MKLVRLIVVTFVFVVAATMTATAARADACSSSGGYVTCKYLDGAGLGAWALVQGSAWNYWKTSTMWRPADRCAEVGYYNGSYIGGQYCGSSSSFSLYGPYGYSVGYCANNTPYFMQPVTCQVFNWYT
jgi:hypothetical protein